MQNYSDRFFCAYFIKPKNIDNANIIFNFCALINDVAFKSKDAIFLHIKLQWYIDALKFPKHEKIGVKEVDDLRNLIDHYNLQVDDFINYIKSKLIDLDLFPFKNIDEILVYATNTENIIWQNIAKINNLELNIDNINFIQNIANSYAILGLLRNFIYFYHTKNTYTLLFGYNETGTNIDEAINNRVKQLLQIANNLIKQSKLLFKKQPKILKKFILLNYFTQSYINNFIKSDSQLLKTDFFNISKFTFLKILVKSLFIR